MFVMEVMEVKAQLMKNLSPMLEMALRMKLARIKLMTSPLMMALMILSYSLILMMTWSMKMTPPILLN